MTTATSSKLSLAILDDYTNTAPKHFTHIPDLEISRFPETLDAAKKDGLEALKQRLHPYPIISSMRERTAFPAELLQDLPNLKLLLTTGPRNAAIDLAAAAERGVVVTGTFGAGEPKKVENFGEDLPPPASGNSVNQHAWALLLGLCSRIPREDSALRRPGGGAWQSGMVVPLGGKKLGIVGLGRFGMGMARTGVLGFGMEVLAWSQHLTQERADAAAEEAGLARGTVKVVGKEELFRTADVVSLHLVLSERSRGVVGEGELGMMKKSGILVNTSRGGLIDEEALIRVLREGGIRGAALDVFCEEPLPADSPWRSQDFKSEVVLSPHMGYVNAGTMNKWYEEQAENVERWIKGEELLYRMN